MMPPCRAPSPDGRAPSAECLPACRHPLPVALDPADVAERLAVAPALDVRGDLLDARPPVVVEPGVAGGVVGALDRPLAGVVAGEHEARALLLVDLLLPEAPEVAVVHDAGGDVELRVVDRLELAPPRADRLEGGGHELHDPARAHPAPRVRPEVALRHPLRLEEAPVERRPEVALRVLAEGGVVAVGDLRALPRLGRLVQRADCPPRRPAAAGAVGAGPLGARRRRERAGGQGDRRGRDHRQAAAQLRAPPMMIAIERKSAATKIATAMLPRLSSSGKSTCGVRRSITR